MDKREREISENIRTERLKQHYTQEEFSEEIGISTNFLYCIESGTSSMSLKTLLRIQEALGVDGNALLGEQRIVFSISHRKLGAEWTADKVINLDSGE